MISFIVFVLVLLCLIFLLGVGYYILLQPRLSIDKIYREDTNTVIILNIQNIDGDPLNISGINVYVDDKPTKCALSMLPPILIRDNAQIRITIPQILGHNKIKIVLISNKGKLSVDTAL